MDGNQVAEFLPQLDSLYRTELLRLAGQSFNLALRASPDLINGVNLNVIEGLSSRYEWHVDSNPVTGLLVLTSSQAETGGRLLFGEEPSSQVALSLKRGQFLIFDARKAPHSVEPLRRNLTRITAPMNFFVAGTLIERPAGLDDSLYGSS